jgi:hypothetical protein
MKPIKKQLPNGECVHSDFSVLQVPCKQHQHSVVPVLQAADEQVNGTISIEKKYGILSV